MQHVVKCAGVLKYALSFYAQTGHISGRAGAAYVNIMYTIEQVNNLLLHYIRCSATMLIENRRFMEGY